MKEFKLLKTNEYSFIMYKEDHYYSSADLHYHIDISESKFRYHAKKYDPHVHSQCGTFLWSSEIKAQRFIDNFLTPYLILNKLSERN